MGSSRRIGVRKKYKPLHLASSPDLSTRFINVDERNQNISHMTVNLRDFFTSIPCTYTSSLLDGMAMNDHFLSTQDTREHAILLCQDPFLSYHLIPDRKTIWTMLGMNPYASSTSEHAIDYAITSQTFNLGVPCGILQRFSGENLPRIIFNHMTSQNEVYCLEFSFGLLDCMYNCALGLWLGDPKASTSRKS